MSGEQSVRIVLIHQKKKERGEMLRAGWRENCEEGGMNGIPPSDDHDRL